jgi:hypothetical protein
VKHAVVMLILMGVLMFATQADAKPVSYAGNWKSNDGTFTAVVKKDSIKIYIHVDDHALLYWDGSFHKNAHDFTSWRSVENTKDCVFCSKDRAKSFSYQDRQLHFVFKLNGAYNLISMKKVK